MARLALLVALVVAGPAAAQPGRPGDAVSKYRHDATAGFGPAAVALLKVFGGLAAVGVAGFVGWLVWPKLLPHPTPDSDPWVKAERARRERAGG